MLIESVHMHIKNIHPAVPSVKVANAQLAIYAIINFNLNLM